MSYAPTLEWSELALQAAARELDRITAVKRLTPQKRLQVVEAVQSYVAMRWASYQAAHAGTAPTPLPCGWIQQQPALADATATLNLIGIDPTALPWWQPQEAA